MIGFCPTCGGAVAEVREAHRVENRHGYNDGSHRPRVFPSGRVVLWPCGHSLPTSVLRLLRP